MGAQGGWWPTGGRGRKAQEPPGGDPPGGSGACLRFDLVRSVRRCSPSGGGSRERARLGAVHVGDRSGMVRRAEMQTHAHATGTPHGDLGGGGRRASHRSARVSCGAQRVVRAWPVRPVLRQAAPAGAWSEPRRRTVGQAIKPQIPRSAARRDSSRQTPGAELRRGPPDARSVVSSSMNVLPAVDWVRFADASDRCIPRMRCPRPLVPLHWCPPPLVPPPLVRRPPGPAARTWRTDRHPQPDDLVPN